MHDVDETWDFVLLASDGIWDVLNNDEVVKMCLKKMERGIPPEEICEEIMTECLSPDLLMMGTDNMTIVLICFLHKKTYDDFCKRAADYCKKLFPDDVKTSDDKNKEKCEQNGVGNGLNDDDDDEDEDGDGDDEDEMHDAKDDNDKNRTTENEHNNENNSNEITENGQNDASPKSAHDDAEQESKKFKDINDETEPK